jgi:hypothetical protein
MMAIGIQQVAYLAGRDYIMTEQTTAPSSYIFQQFRKFVGEREKSFNDRYKSTIEEYRKTHMPKSSEPYITFFHYGHSECSFLDELLRRELAGTFEHTGSVSFSLTRKIAFYPDVSQIEFTDRWIQMCLLDEKDKAAWEESLTAFYQKGKDSAEQPLFQKRTALLQLFLESKNVDSCPHRFAKMVVKAMREHMGALISELLTSEPDLKTIAALDRETQKALAERLFCELYLACSEHCDTNVQVKLTAENVREQILILQFAKIRQVFSKHSTGFEDAEVFIDHIKELLQRAKEAPWIQTAKLQQQFDFTGQRIVKMFETARSAGLENRSDFARLITHKPIHEEISFDGPSEEAIKQLTKIKQYAKLSLLLLDTSSQRPTDLLQTKQKHAMRKLRSLTSPRSMSTQLMSPRTKNKNDTEEVLDGIKRLNLSEGAQETENTSTSALYTLIDTLEAIEGYTLCIADDTL